MHNTLIVLKRGLLNNYSKLCSGDSVVLTIATYFNINISRIECIWHVQSTLGHYISQWTVVQCQKQGHRENYRSKSSVFHFFERYITTPKLDIATMHSTPEMNVRQ